MQLPICGLNYQSFIDTALHQHSNTVWCTSVFPTAKLPIFRKSYRSKHSDCSKRDYNYVFQANLYGIFEHQRKMPVSPGEHVNPGTISENNSTHERKTARKFQNWRVPFLFFFINCCKRHFWNRWRTSMFPLVFP